MTNPFATSSIVMDGTTTEPTDYLHFEPDGLPGEFWLHRRDQFDPTLDRKGVLDQYALPERDSYTVRIVEVPAGVAIRFGTVGSHHGHTGGGDLVDPIEYDSIPETWLREEMSLTDLLEGGC